jgi:hypothetical protein
MYLDNETIIARDPDGHLDRTLNISELQHALDIGVAIPT